MAYAGTRIIHPVRASLTSIASPHISTSHTLYYYCGNFGTLKTWIKGFEPILHGFASDFRYYLFRRRTFMTNFSFSGRGLIMRSVIGVSSIYGVATFSPCFAHAMNSHDLLSNNRHINSWAVPDLEEQPQEFFTFAKKLWLPLIFIATLLMNWDHPIALVVKLSVFLLSTRPSPFSVYLFVEQLCQESMLQNPVLYRFQSLYANKVEIEDYSLLCFARVELSDRKFILIGILGGWWTWPFSPYQAAFSEQNNNALKSFSDMKGNQIS